jgi:hypothetical protein
MFAQVAINLPMFARENWVIIPLFPMFAWDIIKVLIQGTYTMTYNPNAIAQKNYPQFRTDYDRIILDITKPDGTPSKGEFLIPSDELFSMTYGELIEFIENMMPEGYQLISYSFQHA